MSNAGVGMPCPVCRVALVMSERQGVEIDYCPQCRGVWLDRGELDKIIERGTQENLAAAPQAPVQAPQHQAPQHEPRHPQDYGYDPYKQKRRKSFFEELFD